MNRPRLNRRQTEIFQLGLAELGLYRGKIDGDWGDLTQTAYEAAMGGTSDPQAPGPVTLTQTTSDPKSKDPDDWWSGPASLANRTGVRNRNPLNMKGAGIRWKGSKGTDSRGHHIFEDPRLGIRAAAYQLRVNEDTHGKDTLYKTIARWAPTTDTIGSLPGAAPNDPGAYARFVSERTGIHWNKRLDLFAGGRPRPDQIGNLAAIMQAMAEYEIGRGFKIDAEVLLDGIRLL